MSNNNLELKYQLSNEGVGNTKLGYNSGITSENPEYEVKENDKYNTYVGALSGYNVVGRGNILIGAGAGANSTEETPMDNTLIISNNINGDQEFPFIMGEIEDVESNEDTSSRLLTLNTKLKINRDYVENNNPNRYVEILGIDSDGIVGIHTLPTVILPDGDGHIVTEPTINKDTKEFELEVDGENNIRFKQKELVFNATHLTNGDALNIVPDYFNNLSDVNEVVKRVLPNYTEVNLTGVMSVGRQSFANNNVRKVVIEDNIAKIIDNTAFENNPLTNVVIDCDIPQEQFSLLVGDFLQFFPENVKFELREVIYDSFMSYLTVYEIPVARERFLVIGNIPI